MMEAKTSSAMRVTFWMATAVWEMVTQSPSRLPMTSARVKIGQLMWPLRAVVEVAVGEAVAAAVVEEVAVVAAAAEAVEEVIVEVAAVIVEVAAVVVVVAVAQAQVR